MGFFTKKKETKKELPPLKFPEFPKYESEISPTETSQIREAVSTRPFFSIPDLPDMPKEEP